MHKELQDCLPVVLYGLSLSENKTG